MDSSLLLEDISSKTKKDSYLDRAEELKEHLKKIGFYREHPTPELLKEAQQSYHKLNWPPPEDDKGLPIPHPPTTNKADVLDYEVLDELDHHALETPSSYLCHRISILVDYLLQPAECEVDKARILTRWLARCLDGDYLRDLPRSTWSHSESTATYLWKLRRREMDYDELFHVLCKHAGITCYAVEGCVRNTIKYEIGDDFREQRKTWTVAMLDGEWRLLDVRWICEAAYGVLKNNWRLIEDEKGKVSSRRAVRETRGTYKTQVRFRDYYFLTDPEHFIYDHFPDDERYQLLARPLTYEEAKEASSLRSDFFRHGLYLRSHPLCQVLCPDGEITFTIGMTKKKSLAFVYKLYRAKGSREVTSNSRSVLDRYVFLERDLDEGEIRVTIRCPVEGRYLFELHGSETSETHHALMVTYVIECTGINENCKPLPPNIRQEWGPGEDTKDMGMVPITHKKGQVEAEDGDAQIKFGLQKDLEFRHDLIRGEKDVPLSSGHILHSVENGQMAINVRLPEAGEYALNVMAKEKHKKTRFAPACSYLLSCNEEPIQTNPFPDIDGCHVGPNEHFTKMGFTEDDPWPSFINNLVTGEFRMHIKRPAGVYVYATLIFEEGLKTEAFDNYVMCDTQGDTVTITCIFPKSGSFKLTIYARPQNAKELDDDIQIYVKIIDVVLPTLTGMPSPIQTLAPRWCLGYRLKAPRNYYLLANETHKMSLAMPTASLISIKDHPECKLRVTDGQFWEGYVKTGPPGTVIEIMATGGTTDEQYKVFTYEVVTKEELLQIEMKQEQLFQKALDELKATEEQKQSRLIQRMKQAIKERNRTKLHKCLLRMREVNPDKLAEEIASGETILFELEVEEEKVVARKNLRKATRACDLQSLEAVLATCKRLLLPDEDGDISSARDLLNHLRNKHGVDKEDVMNKSRDTVQHAMNSSYTPSNQSVPRLSGLRTVDEPVHLVSKNSGLHIYVMQDDQLPKADFSTVVMLGKNSGKDAATHPLDHSDLKYERDTSTPREGFGEELITPKVAPMNNAANISRITSVPSGYSSIHEDFFDGDEEAEPNGNAAERSFKEAEEALKEIELEENMTKVKSMVRQNMRSASRLAEVDTLQQAIDDFKRLKLDEQEGDLSFAEDKLDIMNCSKDANKTYNAWRKRTMDVFKRYWKVMKEKSAQADETLNDEIDREIQRLRHINTMCRKMAKASKTISRNWDALIESEQSFHDILNEKGDLNGSLSQELDQTTLVQQGVITAEESMKAAFYELATALDKLCGQMIGKAEKSAKELENARIEMEREGVHNGRPASSSLRYDPRARTAMTERERAEQLAIKTSFFALRNNILEEIRAGNHTMEEEIRQKLSELQRKLTDFQGGNSSRNDSLNDFMSSWKI